MTEEQLNMLHEVSILMGQMRKVAEQAAVIKTVYRHLENHTLSEKNGPIEKNDMVVEKNHYLVKKILGELDIIQDVNILSRVHIKELCKQLDPSVEI